MGDPVTSAIGAGTDAFNAFTGLGFGIFDRIRQHALDKYNIFTDRRDFEYTKEMNEQAQKNFEAQMGFQQQQADLAQSNWQQQFDLQKQIHESNRIGNLTKEYNEAGLNPFLAAGMGASTAQAVGGGASTPSANAPNFRNSTSKTLNSQNAIIPQVKMENYIAMKQLKMQEELNEANITKLNSEADLANAQASDILETREYRIELMQAKYNLTLQQAEQVIQTTNKIMQEIENLSTEDQIAKIEKFVLENTKKDKIDQAKAELEKTKAEIKNIEENTKNQGNERRVRTAEQVRKWIDGLISQGIKVGWLMLAAR